MPQLSKKLVNFTDSVIRRMTRISDEYGAVNLSQGFPDFDPPERLKKALGDVARGDVHQYAVTWGAENFRDALADKHLRFSGMEVDPQTEIVVTCGSTEAMIVAMMTVCDEGDKVIVFSPFYENYSADAILSGAEPVYVSLKAPDFSFDREELENAFRQGPKAIIVCNPSNPTGKVFTRDELSFIADMAERYDTFVITDEVYEHIVFEPHEHIHFASLPGMRERTITCSSLSKTYSITGWRLGYLISSPEIIDGARKIHDFITVGAPAPLQEAAVEALRFDDGYYRELRDIYAAKKELFLKGLDDLGLKYTVPQGAYYVLLDVSEFGVKDDLRFCEWMAEEVGVGAVPGSSFFREDVSDYVRLHFAKKEATLMEALRRLSHLREKALAVQGRF